MNENNFFGIVTNKLFLNILFEISLSLSVMLTVC